MVFAIYNNADGGGAHHGGACPLNPIQGVIFGVTSMTLILGDGTIHSDYLHAVP
ncbi:MAG: hypothetical protein HQ523_12105 [Lentisphaerae bacterium]|nr:hypothetical protein [Lentisphaerota bacterium]